MTDIGEQVLNILCIGLDKLVYTVEGNITGSAMCGLASAFSGYDYISRLGEQANQPSILFARFGAVFYGLGSLAYAKIAYKNYKNRIVPAEELENQPR